MTDESSENPVANLSDVQAEENLIGQLVMNRRGAALEAAMDLDATDFYSQACKVAYAAMVDLALDGAEISTVSIGDALAQAGMDRYLVLTWAGQEWHGSWESLVARVQSMARRRKIFTAGRALSTGAIADGIDELALVEQVLNDLGQLSVTMASDVLAGLSDLDIMMRDVGENPYLVDGILYPMDRIIVVAAEGDGKTLLGRQVALCVQAGLHPFTRHPLTNGPIKTLTMDLENRPRAVTHNTELIMTALRRVPGQENFTPTGTTIEIPDGIDLTSSVDRRRFDATIRVHQPDLLFLGPLYKAFRPADGTANEARVADEVAKFLDRMSRKHKFALWIEAHAPFGATQRSRDLRPYGSSYWMRWPEYGVNFTVDPKELHKLKIGKFRNHRGLVYWPPELIRGMDDWPFTGKYKTVDQNVYGRPATEADRIR